MNDSHRKEIAEQLRDLVEAVETDYFMELKDINEELDLIRKTVNGRYTVKTMIGLGFIVWDLKIGASADIGLYMDLGEAWKMADKMNQWEKEDRTAKEYA